MSAPVIPTRPAPPVATWRVHRPKRNSRHRFVATISTLYLSPVEMHGSENLLDTIRWVIDHMAPGDRLNVNATL